MKQPACIDRILLTESAIEQRVCELGKQISDDYYGKEPVFICVLKGAIVFFADLIRCMELSPRLDFIHVSSYGNRTCSSGKVNIVQDIMTDIKGEDVLIVDDIMDSGITLHRLKDNILSRNPSSLKTCVLLDKPQRRIEDIKTDYTGFEIPDEFAVGYGMDYKGQYRNLRYIAAIKRSLEYGR